jgi:hypothetical protein
MKTFASILAQVGPIIVVFGLLEFRRKEKKRVLLKHMGLALFASGICSHLGAKYLGLSVFGRYSEIDGERGAEAALFLAALGAVLFIIHFALCALFPRFMYVRENQRKG